MSDQSFDSYAIVELMGHVKMAGRVTEEERFGSKMGRCDVPTLVGCPECGGKGWEEGGIGPVGQIEQLKCEECEGEGRIDGFASVYFTGSSVYRLSPCSEEVARHVAKRNQPEPVHQWELPKQLEVATLPRRASNPTDYDSDDYPDPEDDPERNG